MSDMEQDRQTEADHLNWDIASLAVSTEKMLRRFADAGLRSLNESKADKESEDRKRRDSATQLAGWRMTLGNLVDRKKREIERRKDEERALETNARQLHSSSAQRSFQLAMEIQSARRRQSEYELNLLTEMMRRISAALSKEGTEIFTTPAGTELPLPDRPLSPRPGPPPGLPGPPPGLPGLRTAVPGQNDGLLKLGSLDKCGK